MPITYIPYIPDPIEGQALLNNFTRTQRALKYRDYKQVFTRIRRGLPLYQVETLEKVGDNPNNNLLLRGECIAACAYLKANNIQIDLVYIDPPFASGAAYAKKIYVRRNPKVAEALEKAEQELNDDELRAFEETMYGDIWHKEDYLNWMYENLMAIRSVMSETASIYVHLDWHIGHYVKVLMDEIFGEDNFKNEVIWAYSGRGISKTNWNRKHDTIYFYTKSDNHFFDYNGVREEYAEETKKKFKYWDEEKQDFYQIRGKNIQGSPVQSADGLLREDEVTYAGLTYRQYRGEGMLAKDWFEIQPVNKAANERTDYATQKPEELLQRILKGSSREGMLIADFFGGSGVTAQVAHDLGRRFIHVDVGINSIQTTRDRLLAAGASFEILDLQDGVALFRNPAQTMEKLKTLITGLCNEDALDSFWEGAIFDTKEGMIPVYVPNLLDHSQKVLDVPALNRILQEALPDLLDLSEPVKKVIVYYVDAEDLPALEKFAADHNPTEIKIEFRDLKQLLSETVANDIIESALTEAGGTWSVEITKFISDRLLSKIDEYNQKRGRNGGRVKQQALPEAQVENGEDNGGHEQADNGNGNGGEPKPQQSPFQPIEISDTGLELIELVALDATNTEGAWHSDAEIKMDKNGYVIRNGKKTKEFWDSKISIGKRPLRLKVRNIAGDETILSL